MPPNNTFVSVNTGEINRLVKAVFVSGWMINEPPKYLNKSKLAVTTYLIQFAPDATKVTIIVIKYNKIEIDVEMIPFLNIVDIANAIIMNNQILINTHAKYIRYISGDGIVKAYFALNTASIGSEFRS